MVFADPPFNIGKKYGKYQDRRADYRLWCEEWIAECWRILKPTGSFYLMTSTRHLWWKMPLMAHHFVNLICWKNMSAQHSDKSYWPAYQPILFYAKTPDYHFDAYAQPDRNIVPRWADHPSGPRYQMKDVWDDIPYIYSGLTQENSATGQPGGRLCMPTPRPGHKWTSN